MSHPSWVRGLKLKRDNSFLLNSKSHPSWVRGLKLFLSIIKLIHLRRTPRGCVD